MDILNRVESLLEESKNLPKILPNGDLFQSPDPNLRGILIYHYEILLWQLKNYEMVNDFILNNDALKQKGWVPLKLKELLLQDGLVGTAEEVYERHNKPGCNIRDTMILFGMSYADIYRELTGNSL